MPADIKLIWENPSTPEDRLHPEMLRMLGDFLAGAGRMGYVQKAKDIAANQKLTPLATTVVCDQMRLSGLTEALIRRIV